MAKFTFRESAKVKNEIALEQAKQIRQMYEDILKETREKIKLLSVKQLTGNKAIQLKQLEQELVKSYSNISDRITEAIKTNSNLVLNAVINDAKNLAGKIGFNASMAYAKVPEKVIEKIVSGQIYQEGWTLSKALWKDEELNRQTLQNIIAKGIAGNKSTLEIAKTLESFVDPKAVKPWDWGKVYPGSKQKIDYNAQRLARTMVNHAYQQGVKEVIKDNPFIEKVRWLSALDAKRTCPLCESRNDVLFDKKDVPLDHPNGLCTLAPEVDDLQDIAKKAKEWKDAPDGTYPEIDKYAKSLGYIKPEKQISLNDQMYDLYLKINWSSIPKFGMISKSDYLSQIINLKQKSGQPFLPSDLSDFKAIIENDLSLGKYYTKTELLQIMLKPEKLDDYVAAHELKMAEQKVKKKAKYEAAKNITNTVTKQTVSQTLNQTTNVPTVFDKEEWDKGYEALKERAYKGKTTEYVDELHSSFLELQTQVPESQIEGITTYTGGEYREMNGYLRGNPKYKRVSKDIKDYIDKAQKALSKASLPEDIYTARGAGIDSLLHGTGNGDKGEEWLGNNYKSLINSVANDKGFVSTSITRPWGNDIKYILKVPKGYQAALVAPVSLHEKEMEILLNSDVTFVIKHIEKKSWSSYEVYAEVLPK